MIYADTAADIEKRLDPPFGPRRARRIQPVVATRKGWARPASNLRSAALAFVVTVSIVVRLDGLMMGW